MLHYNYFFSLQFDHALTGCITVSFSACFDYTCLHWLYSNICFHKVYELPVFLTLNSPKSAPQYSRRPPQFCHPPFENSGYGPDWYYMFFFIAYILLHVHAYTVLDMQTHGLGLSPNSKKLMYCC